MYSIVVCIDFIHLRPCSEPRFTLKFFGSLYLLKTTMVGILNFDLAFTFDLAFYKMVYFSDPPPPATAKFYFIQARDSPPPLVSYLKTRLGVYSSAR